MTAALAASPSNPSTQRPSTCTREACDTCRDKKCNGGKPCSRCAQRNLDCVYESRHHRTKRSLRDEIAALKRKNQEKDHVIEGLRHEHGHEHSQKQDYGQSALLSPPSSTDVSVPDHQSDSTPSHSSQQEPTPFFDTHRASDASNAFVDMNAGSSQMASDLFHVESTMSAQGVLVLNPTNGPASVYDGSSYLPWADLSQGQESNYPALDSDRSLSFGTDATSASQDVEPVFTLHNSNSLGMSNNMGASQMPSFPPWNAYQPTPAGTVTPVTQPADAANTAPTPPLPPSRVQAERRSTPSPTPAAEDRPACRERHRIASARNWRKQKTAMSDLQTTKQHVETEHTALQSQYAEVAEQVRFAKHALFDHMGCDDPAIGRWLKNEAQHKGSRRAEPNEAPRIWQRKTEPR
ncbi:hypothetical protein ACHAQA_010111 [Verticillium albo-atrum]